MNVYASSNLVGSTGQSWRCRNNFITTNFSQFKDKGTYRRASKSFVADNLLSDDKMQSAATKTMYSSLKQDAAKLEKSRKLVEGMAKLKEIKLLSGRDFNKTSYPGVIRGEHIINDYHWKQTNPGYSRNPMGGKHFFK
jgi:hypothetical protein